MSHSSAAKRPLTDDESWIVSHNLPLVDSCLRGRRQYHDDATWHDLRAAGYLGLCRAIKLYNPEFACWSTYAYWWIKSFIQRELIHQRLIRVPEYHESGRQDEDAERAKRHNGDQAARVLNGQRIHWDDEEVAMAMATMPAREVGDDQRDFIAACLAKLSAVDREIVCRLAAGERPKDVARAAGMSVGRIHSLNSYAIRRIRISMGITT